MTNLIAMTFLQPRDAAHLARVLDGRQGEVAKAIGTSRQRINHLASGRAPRIRLELGAAIENYLQLPRGDLFTLNPDQADLIGEYLQARRNAT
jgi:DNA-binding Xre family transcriptional regulator